MKRRYEELYGDAVPVITTAIITGRATLRVGKMTLAARFRFTHRAGESYEHLIEAGWFGMMFLRIKERFMDGHARLDLPTGVVEGRPNVDQAANLALWGEAMWFPSVFLTDPRVRWMAVDDHTAVLFVPFKDSEQTLTVRFDSDTGYPVLIAAMRYKEAEDTKKRLWLASYRRWRPFGEFILPSAAALTWLGDGPPWAEFHVEHVAYNTSVSLD